MRAAWVLMLVGACTKGVEHKKEPVAETKVVVPIDAPAPTLAGLKVTIGGQPVPMAHAYMKKLAIAGRYQVFVTNKTSSCGELMDNLFSARDGEQTLLFNLGQRIAPDGTLTGVVTDYFDPSINLEDGGTGSINGTTVTADFKAKSDKTAIEVHGTFPAEACGEQPADPSGVPKAKHASTATIEFAGKQLPLVGAVLFKDDVLLSTGPKTCDRWIPDSEVLIWRRGGFWHGNGRWLANEISNNSLPDPKTAGVKIARGAKGTSEDGATVQLTLSGNGTIDKYPFTLAGTIEALDCHGDDGVIP